ncbi:MAG: hypothetical protein AAB855_00760 [Patescibacteria group bacterium]
MTKAKYWIAKHISDPFRNEPRNIGVIVEMNGMRDAKFVGETRLGHIDGRTIRSDFSHPEVYRQWVEYWRSEMDRGIGDISNRGGKAHYGLFPAGEVSDLGNDSIADVTKHLFDLLVSIRPVAENADLISDVPAKRLEVTVSEMLREKHILGSPDERGDEKLVRPRISVKGRKATHVPEFAQINGSVCAIQTIDFTPSQKLRVVDHAGLTAYMFRDISEEHMSTANLYTIVRASDEDRRLPEVAYGLGLVQNESQVIDWFDDKARDKFLDERLSASTSH